MPAAIHADRAFWRVVGLYLAEGHCARDGRRMRLRWSFHPTDEPELVEEVAGFWRSRGVKADVRQGTTATYVAGDSAEQWHTWHTAGTFTAKAKAYYTFDTTKFSVWSAGHNIVVGP